MSDGVSKPFIYLLNFSVLLVFAKFVFSSSLIKLKTRKTLANRETEKPRPISDHLLCRK